MKHKVEDIESYENIKIEDVESQRTLSPMKHKTEDVESYET